MHHKIYAYGTLMPSAGHREYPLEMRGKREVHTGGVMYDLGWFPGLKLEGTSEFVTEYFLCDDLTVYDRYEGFREDDPAGSLYIRRPFLDGWIYEYNGDVGRAPRIPSGDWLGRGV